MARSAAILVLLSLAAVAIAMPIPSRPEGFPISGSPSSPVHLDMYADLLCPDCHEAWPVVKQVAAHYGSKLHVRVQLFALPYHAWCFATHQGMYIVEKYNSTGQLAYMDAIFANQPPFWNDATAGLTGKQVHMNLGSIVEKAGVMSQSKFVAGLTEVPLNQKARISFKYACSRGVTGTPSFHINGVHVDVEEGATLADWQKIIDPLLP